MAPKKLVATYARLSSDRDRDKASIEVQVEECQREAERRGWTVSDVYIDRNRSASLPGRKRPEFDRLMADVRAGKVSTILVRETSRLYRKPRELEDLLDLADAGTVKVVSLFEGEVDFGSSNGRMMARVRVAVDKAESERMGERIRLAKAARRRQGRYNGSQRCIGYETDPDAPGGLRVVPEEADRIRGAVRRIIGGASVYSILQAWNSEGFLTPEGAAWRTANLGRTLKRRTLVGRFENDDAQGAWTPILTEDEHRLLVAAMARGSKPARPSRRRALLSGGLIVCAECDRPLVYSAGRYRCDPSRSGGCGKVRVHNGRALEALVLDLARDRWLATKDDVPEPQTDADQEATLAELAKVEARLDELASAYGEGELDRRAYGIAKAKAEASRQELVERLGDLTPDAEAAELDDEALVEWQRGDDLEPEEVERLQSPLRALLGKVYVAPAAAKFERGLDPARIRVELD